MPLTTESMYKLDVIYTWMCIYVEIKNAIEYAPALGEEGLNYILP